MKYLKLQFVVAGILMLVAGVALAGPDGMKLSSKEGLGSYLTDANGKAIYWFKNDAPGNSACSGQCLENWPVFFQETVTPPQGVDVKDFGVITRKDGKKQTTFRGYPLYYYAMDKNAGDVVGQGKDSTWFVIDTAAFPAKAPGTDPSKGRAPGADPHKGMTPSAPPSDPHQGMAPAAPPAKGY